jgi:hypothetical protein
VKGVRRLAAAVLGFVSEGFATHTGLDHSRVQGQVERTSVALDAGVFRFGGGVAWGTQRPEHRG